MAASATRGVSIPPGLDWPALLRAAAWHGLRPLLAAHLGPAAGGVPPAVREELEGAARAHARRNVALTAELLRLVERLGREGIRVLPYKGPVLASALYGSVAWREFFDLDLLVRREDVSAAARVLRGEGYQAQLRLTAAQEADALGSRHEQVFVREDGGAVVELQWRIAPFYFAVDLDHAPLWDRAERVSIAGREVATLGPEDLLLALCVHGTKHRWERVIWILDVAQLLRARPELDWGQAIARARGLGLLRMLGLGLRLADGLPGAPPLPARARGILADPALDALAGETWAWALSRPGASVGVLATARYHLRARERLRDRARYVTRLALATTPGDWGAVRLPDALFPLYNVVRLGRLALKYGPRVFRHARDGAFRS